MGTQCVNASIAQLCGIQSTLLLPVSNCSGYGGLAPRIKINLKNPIWRNPNPTFLTKRNELSAFKYRNGHFYRYSLITTSMMEEYLSNDRSFKKITCRLFSKLKQCEFTSLKVG